MSNANEARISALLKQMTLEEKGGRMAQVSIDVIRPQNSNTKILDFGF